MGDMLADAYDQIAALQERIGSQVNEICDLKQRIDELMETLRALGVEEGDRALADLAKEGK